MIRWGAGTDGRWAEHGPPHMHGLRGKRMNGCQQGEAADEKTECACSIAHTQQSESELASEQRADAHASEPYTSDVGRFRPPKLRKLPSNGPQAALCYRSSYQSKYPRCVAMTRFGCWWTCAAIGKGLPPPRSPRHQSEVRGKRWQVWEIAHPSSSSRKS